MDEKKLMMEAKILKSFLNDFNHIPEMDNGMEKPEVSLEIESEGPEGEEKPEGACEDCGKEPCECDDEDMKSSKPMLDKMLKG